MDISRHRPICGLFPAECQSLRFPAIRGLLRRGKNERKGSLSLLPRRERPLIAGNLYGRLFNDSSSNYLQNIFTALAVGLSGELERTLERFSSLPSNLGILYLGKRDEKHS